MDVLVLSASTQSSPEVQVAFYFGRCYPEASEVERRCGFQPAYYQVHQLSDNAPQMKGLGIGTAYRWTVNIETAAPAVHEEIEAAVRQVAYPFFERFTSMRDAQAALASGDTWCIGARGVFWRQLFAVDVALQDVDHFRAWAESLDPFSRAQAREALSRLSANR